MSEKKLTWQEITELNGIQVFISSLPDGERIWLEIDEIPRNAFDKNGKMIDEEKILQVGFSKSWGFKTL